MTFSRRYLVLGTAVYIKYYSTFKIVEIFYGEEFREQFFSRYCPFCSLFSDTSKICRIDAIISSEDAQGPSALPLQTHSTSSPSLIPTRAHIAHM